MTTVQIDLTDEQVQNILSPLLQKYLLEIGGPGEARAPQGEKLIPAEPVKVNEAFWLAWRYLGCPDRI